MTSSPPMVGASDLSVGTVQPWRHSFQPNIQTYVHIVTGPARRPLADDATCNPGIMEVGSLPTFASVLIFALSWPDTVRALNEARYLLPNDVYRITICTENERGRYNRKHFWGPHSYSSLFVDDENQPKTRVDETEDDGGRVNRGQTIDVTDEDMCQLLWEDFKETLGTGSYNLKPLVEIHLADEFGRGH